MSPFPQSSRTQFQKTPIPLGTFQGLSWTLKDKPLSALKNDTSFSPPPPPPRHDP
ncbi:hypothetical protein CCM_04847 [Cordyceps militaris CM01]|uniref:Uncharacterized protein n=1 Tax=Cordyceps militaris (strain CM01) TaxID=983644 RepID=G3JEY0_CORMM|nr:uncharacterized protein CCM_04847 [Cordyceps militaris CM01]EGX93473.1 hypothetical protein CCM_04847 [Cordyceps militaris CM01]